jgi:hypothetical protein
MIKKEYMSPEMEMIDIELENAILSLSTDNGDYDSDEIIDI